VNFPPDDPNPATKPPNLTDTLWPDLLIFVDGDVSVSDVGFRVTSSVPMQTWGLFGMEFHEMLSAVRVMMAKGPMNVSIRRIAVQGLPDATSVWGYNLINCVIVAGEQPAPTIVGDWRQDHIPFTGNVAITDNHFRGCTSSDAFSHHIGSRIVISRNVSEDVGYGVEHGNVEGSLVEISGNRAAATQFGVILYNPYYPAEKPSRFVIRDNDLLVAGPAAWDGIALYDNSGPGETKSQDAVISGNRVETRAAGGSAIHASFTRGTQIWSNRIAGTAAAGIRLQGATWCAAVENRLDGFTPAPDQARIVLDANTSHCLVVGAYEETDVLDLGRDNLVVDRRR
jgi:hypothetical protein